MPDIHVLEKVARECGQLVKRMRDNGLSARNKQEQLGAHFVTNADTASQKRGITLLRRQYPKEIVIGEEGKKKPIILPDCTVFDPLDGTVNCFNGGREYGVTLCTFRNARPELGVMYWPEDDVLISAVRGKGCWRDGFKTGQRLTIPPWHQKRDKMLVATDVGPWMGRAERAVLRSILGRHNVVSHMAAIYGARVVIEGSAAFYYNLNIAKIWDGAAGSLAVQEAGGVALDPYGKPLQWNAYRLDWVYARDAKMARYALTHLKRWKPRKKNK